MAERTYRRDVHETDLLPDVGLGVVHHGDKDPQGSNVTENAVGVVYGLTPAPDDGWVESVLHRPQDVLPTFDGPFFIACADRSTDRYVIATDKMGSRTAYFMNDGTFAFGSELKSLLPLLPDPTLDARAVCDLVLMAHVWGSKTLVEEIQSLPPATVATYDDGDLSIDPYWDYTFESAPEQGYVDSVASAYESVIGELADTVDGRLGIWLSGGLDSRTMAVALHRRRDDFHTLTYNRPLERESSPFKSDIDLAKDVSAVLGVNNTSIHMTATKLADRLEEVVEMTDGMVGWHTLTNLAAIFDLDPATIDVVLEGAAATILCGEKVPVESLRGDRAPEAELYRLNERVDRDVVRSVLAPDVSPKRTFVEAVQRSDQTTPAAQILGATNRNYYRGKHFMSDKISRGFFGTRQPYSNGQLLDEIARMPPRYRRRMLPFTREKIPHVPSLMKLELARRFDDGSEQIRYQGTQLRPSRPHWMHGLGFVVTTAYERLFLPRTITTWYESNDQFRALFDTSLDRAAELPVFDSAGVDRLREEHFRGTQDHFEALASISTVDLFVQTVLDGRSGG
jgi:asparagine synthase (glutamine-hydrolysing)